MSKSIELREDMGRLVEQARSMVDVAEAESRAFNADEEQTYQNIDAEIDALESRIAKVEAQEAREAALALSQNAERASVESGEDRDEHVADEKRASKEYEERFSRYLRGGKDSLTSDEYRALQADSDEAGGFTVVPEQFINRLIKFVDDAVHIRRISSTFTLTNAQSIGAPSLDADPADADWTSELGTGSEDSAMDFGKRTMRPNPLAKRIKVSQKLLRASAQPIERLVRERLGYKFAVTEEKGFLTGTGANQPLGVFTASNDGIGTAQDVSTDNTTTAITADGLINAKFNLKGQYQMSPNTRWVFHRDAVKMIRKLKDGNSQYLWQPGLAGGQPATILDVPYLMSEYAPNTFTTGLYVGIIGDFTHYWIVDALDMQLQRLNELYAETNQVGFIGRRELDAAPVLAEAFTRVTLA